MQCTYVYTYLLIPEGKGFVLNGSASSTWPRPSLISKQFSPVNIVLNDSAQRLVTLYLVFKWFEWYLNKIKQVEWFYIISSNMYIHDCKVENFNWYMYLCIQKIKRIYLCMYEIKYTYINMYTCKNASGFVFIY